MSTALRISIVVVSFMLFCSCEKAIENKQQNLLLELMTNGQWHVEIYKEGTVLLTDDFLNYNFQFKDDGSVSGTNNIITETGTWVADIQNYSITSNFPYAIYPLKKLNGIWKLTDSNVEFVRAEMNTAQGKNILHLRKNP
jgi:hypothetical protein